MLSDALIRQRAADITLKSYYRSVVRLRVRPLTITIVLFLLLSATIPFLFPHLPFSPWLSLALLLVQAAITVVCQLAIERSGPTGRPYIIASRLEMWWWCIACGALIVAGGSVASVFWGGLVVMVILQVNTLQRHDEYRAALLGGSLIATLGFLLTHHPSDAGWSALLGATFYGCHRMSTLNGRREISARAVIELEAEANAMMSSELERQRIARELHDGLAAELTAALWQASALSGEDAEDVQQSLQDSLVSLRTLVHDVRGQRMAVQSAGQELKRILSRLCSAADVVFTLKCELAYPQQSLPGEVVSTILRTCQEACRNAITHGRCTALFITLNQHKDELSLIIKDDGIGVRANPEGLGLTNLRARLDALSGTLTLTEGEIGGTTVTASLPLVD